LKGKRLHLVIIAAVVLAIIVTLVTVIVLKRRPRIQVPQQVKTEIDHPEMGVRLVSLYFPNTNGSSLGRETRALNVTADKSVQLRALVEELSHPRYYAHLPCLPKGAEFRNLLIDNQGLAYVDLTSEFLRNHPGGLTGEQFSIRCLALTLVDNFPEITAVKILVDGSEIETIAGHVDASEPFIIDELRRLTDVR